MFALAVALIALLAASVFVTGRRYRLEQQWLLHTYQVREQIPGLASNLQQAEMKARDYGLAGDAPKFTGYWHAIGAVEHDLDALEALVADNTDQLALANLQLQASLRTQSIRVATSELVVHSHGGTLAHATVSMGVASFPEHGATPEVLPRMADQALYRARQPGRNRVASAGDSGGQARATPAV